MLTSMYCQSRKYHIVGVDHRGSSGSLDHRWITAEMIHLKNIIKSVSYGFVYFSHFSKMPYLRGGSSRFFHTGVVIHPKRHY